MKSSSKLSVRSGRSALFFGVVMITSSLAVFAPPAGAADVNVPFTAVTTIFAEDFELGASGWTSGGTASSWALGTPTAAGGPAGPWSGANSWATNLAGTYNNSECSWVRSPPIPLPAAGASVDGVEASVARLAFKHWLDIENRWDGAVIQVSTNGGANWTIVAPPGGYPADLQTTARRCLLGTTAATPPAQRGWSSNMSATNTSWLDAEVDLTAFLGQTVEVRFAFGSDSIIVRKGWAFDDVVVQVGAGAFASTPDPTVDAVSTFTPITAIFADDFELGANGWTAGGNLSSWALGTPSGSAGPSGPFSGVNVWGTNLTGNYNNNECSRLVSPSITLPGAGADLPDGVRVEAARVAFKQWFNSENRYDGGRVQISTDDGATWQALDLDPPYNDIANTVAVRNCMGMSATDKYQTNVLSARPDEWLDASADLTAYLGQTVRIGFLLATDGSVVRGGWYVDDVAVIAGIGATVAPPAPDTNVTIPYTSVVAYEEGFEDGVDGLNGWTPVQRKVDTRTYLNSWQLGTPTAASGPITTSKVWGTNLSGNYNNNDCAAVVSPPLDLTGIAAGASVRLDWQQWMRTSISSDGGVVAVSTNDGASWNVVNPTVAYPRVINSVARQCLLGVFSSTPPTQNGYSGNLSATSTSWSTQSIDLSGYVGQNVRVRYHWASDGSTNSFPGWFVDNVALVVDGTNAAVFDFESGDQGWSAATTPIPAPMSWETGAPSVVGPAAAAEGSSVLATNVNGNYADGECTAVESPSIDLTDYPEALGARLTMAQWFSTSGSGDAGLVQMRVDGGGWTTIAPTGGYTGTMFSYAYSCMGMPSTTTAFRGAIDSDVNAWSTKEYVLQGASGHTVQFRLLFAGDNSTNSAGWYIDDVTLSVGVGGQTIDLADPSSSGRSGRFDNRLAEALAGEGPHGDAKFLTVVVGGPEIVATTSTDRVGVMAYYEEQARPWFDVIEAFVIENEGEITHSFAAVPAIVATVPRHAVPDLVRIQGVRSVELDDDESLKLIAPEPGGDEGITPLNAESVPMTGAPEIWARGYRGEGMKISVIDTGIYADHPVFKVAPDCTSNRVIAFKDYVNNQVAPYDDNGHGTHVAGTAAGSNECGGWANGMAPKASLMGVKFLSATGSGSFANGMAALQWSFDNGADVTSNSWGHPTCTIDLNILRLVNTLTKAGMPNVFAAGNSGPSGRVGNPACADYAISVGATDKAMVKASYSSIGPCTDPTESNVQRICPDVMAVGSGVVSAVPSGSCQLCKPWGYNYLNGTSMATPHVAGAVALMIQFKKALTGTDWDTAGQAEKSALKITAIDLGAPGEDNSYGAGFIQLLPIYNAIANPGLPDIRDVLTVPAADLRVGNSGTLLFRVSNAGTRQVTGDFMVTLTRPDGSQVLDDREVVLGWGGAATHSMLFSVSTATAAGTYTYSGDFVYSWVDDNNVVQTGEVHRTGSFVVRKIDLIVGRSLLDSTHVGAAETVVLTVENRGNEDARNVTLDETIRHAYRLLPGSPDPLNSNWIYGGSPAPNSVAVDNSFGRTTLGWVIGDLPQGASLELSYSEVATRDGTFPFVGLLKYRDGAGVLYLRGATDVQTVSLTPTLPSL